MPKYTVYFTKEIYGYKTFKAKDDEKAEEIIEDMEINGNFPDDFDSVKSEGFLFVDWDKE